MEGGPQKGNHYVWPAEMPPGFVLGEIRGKVDGMASTLAEMNTRLTSRDTSIESRVGKLERDKYLILGGFAVISIIGSAITTFVSNWIIFKGMP